MVEPGPHARIDRVYVTDDPVRAMEYAARSRPRLREASQAAGAVYEVEALGPLEEDPYNFTDFLLCAILGSSLGPQACPQVEGGAWTTGAARIVRVLATDVVLSEAALDAALEAADLVEALLEVHHLPYWQQVLSRVLLHEQGSVRDRLAAELGWPEATIGSGMGAPAGWSPCRLIRERWGQCGGAEVRWTPGPVGGLRGRRCPVIHERRSA